MIVACVQYLLKLRSLSDTWKIVISLVIGPTVVGMYFFVKNILIESAMLCTEKPTRTPLEQQHFADAKAAIEQFGEFRQDIETALRHLRKYEILTFSGYHSPPLPKGMSAKNLRENLNLCVAESLVTQMLGELRSDGPYPVHDEIYTIAPGMKTALDELLYPATYSPKPTP